jgi:hypothetical protein
MRIFSGVLCLLLIVFAAFQYNDPDFWLWGGIYGLAALFAGLAAILPGAMSAGRGRLAYLVCFALSLAGGYYYWPDTPEWWSPKVWSDAAVMSDGTEIAREGMGMMIVAFAMLIAGLTVLRRRA